jgi:SAM-dependent methyltransferase
VLGVEDARGYRVSWMGRVVKVLPTGVRRVVERWRYNAMVAWQFSFGVRDRTCPLCGFHGRFRPFGFPPAFDAMCRQCDSLQRHRLFARMDEQNEILLGVKSLLHFAPEPLLSATFKKRFDEYKTADLFREDVDFKCNIESNGLGAQTFDAVFVSHVLEHVNDTLALAELNRILKPGGKLIAMVPIVEGWNETYENPSVTSGRDRNVHFGQKDHIRFYGQDFTKRLAAAGFTVTSYMASPQECIEFSLERGEKVFVGLKVVV